MGKTVIITILVFLLDQLSKWYVVFYLDLKTRLAIDVMPPLLNFRMGWNEGVNFGLFSNSAETLRWVLIALAVVISIAIVWYARRYKGWASAFFFGSIAGGALANALDRANHGAVADFLNMSCCGINNPYAFNIADIFVFIGAFGLIIFSEKLAKRA